jgi:hypothetical protein
MWKADPKYKHIYKNKHDHIHIYIDNTLNSGRKENRIRESTILKYIASVPTDAITICRR